MTPEQFLGWVRVALALKNEVLLDWGKIRAIFSFHGLSEAEQDDILDGVIANAGVRKRRSRQIADGT